MTREEAIKELEPLHEEIDALKQMLVELVDEFKESALNKIRNEITDLVYDDPEEDYEYGYNRALINAAQIIDKYKAESEDRYGKRT